MKKHRVRHLILATLLAICAAVALTHAQQGTLSAVEKQRRIDTEAELQSIAVVERKVLLPMPDGVRLATDIYRPKNAAGKVPIVFVRTPYNFNFWDINNGVPADMTAPLTAVKRGYAYVVQNERGHFFSEGHYDILGAPRSDGYNAVDWLSKQPWSNGRIGTTGCSSTAEYQMGIAALGHPAYAAMNVQGFGAGVGRVAPYYEQGNWYRGGPYHDDMKLNVPGLWFMSWYDVSVGPNLALYNHVRRTAPAEVASQQWAVIAPVAHCAYTRATAQTIVGERSMGDARLDYNEIVYGFFDRFLKGEKNGRLDSLPKVTYFTMGLNKWQTAESWPPPGAQPMTFYLSSGGRANSLAGDGALTAAAPDADKPDPFAYDPMNPVLS